MRVEDFDRWARSYDAGALQYGLYHAMHDESLRAALRLRCGPGRALDLGCGTGQLLRRAAQMMPGCLLVGVDPAGQMLVRAARNAPSARLIRAEAAALPFPSASFDLITCTATLRHWPDLQAGLREAARVLTDDGVLIIADFFERQPRAAWPVRRRIDALPASLKRAVSTAKLRLTLVREIAGYGPVPRTTMAVAAK